MFEKQMQAILDAIHADKAHRRRLMVEAEILRWLLPQWDSDNVSIPDFAAAVKDTVDQYLGNGSVG